MKKPMTKTEEMQILDAAIANLGSDSYLGLWLESVRAEVLRDVQSDYIPRITIATTRAECDRMRQEASKDAEAIVHGAIVKAAKIKQDSERWLDNATSKLRDALRRLTE